MNEERAGGGRGSTVSSTRDRERDENFMISYFIFKAISVHAVPHFVLLNIELDFNFQHSTVYIERYSISSICKKRQRKRERESERKSDWEIPMILTEIYKNFK